MRRTLPSVTDRDRLFDGLDETQQEIVGAVLKGKTNQIRASKPSLGPAAYVWRHVVFLVSPNRAHQCMPIMAEFDVREEDFAHRSDTYEPRNETQSDRDTVAGWDDKTWDRMNRGARRRAYIKEELSPLVDRIVDHISKDQWHGVRRWGRALGAL